MDTPPELSARCALEGCDVPVVRARRGGRPRLYCSDAHRAEARRRRTAGPAGLAAPVPDGHTSDDPFDQARRFLTAALSSLEGAPRLPSYDAVLADARAAATAEVLRAQQAAADALRRAAQSDARLGEERAEWHRTRQTLEDERRAAAERIEQLDAALEGARSALDAELVSHHQEVAALAADLATLRTLHETTMSALEHELEVERRNLADSDARVRAAEADLAAAGAQISAVTGRIAAAEEAAAAAHARASAAESQLRVAEGQALDARLLAAQESDRADRLAHELERLAASRKHQPVARASRRTRTPGSRRYRPGSPTA